MAEQPRSWGRVSSAPNEYLIHLRRGRVVTHGAGRAAFAWPWDSWVVVPTSIQRVSFAADQVTAERVGVEVRGIAVFRVADPMLAFRVLDFSGPRPMDRLAEVLRDMFVGAARRLVANMTVDACLGRRKEEIAVELLREIQPIVGGTGRPQDATDRGWGLVVDSIEIHDVKILSERVFADLQAPYRASLEQRARASAVERDQEVHQREVAAEQDRLALARHTAALEHELAVQLAEQTAARERRRIEDELALLDAALDIERRRSLQQLEIARLTREVENLVSRERIEHDYVTHVLPQLAAAMMDHVGQVQLTQIQGAGEPAGVLGALLAQLRALSSPD